LSVIRIKEGAALQGIHGKEKREWDLFYNIASNGHFTARPAMP
jgi:hypothetical protein